MSLKAYNVRLFLNDSSTQGVFYVEAHTPGEATKKARHLAERQHNRPAYQFRFASISRGVAVSDPSALRAQEVVKEGELPF